MLRMSSTESGQVEGYNPVGHVRRGNCIIYSCQRAARPTNRGEKRVSQSEHVRNTCQPQKAG
jgi:hypothetical protein